MGLLRNPRTVIGSGPCSLSPGKEYKEARIDSKIENEIKKYTIENSREEVRENLEQNFRKTPYLLKEGLGRFSKYCHLIGGKFHPIRWPRITVADLNSK